MTLLLRWWCWYKATVGQSAAVLQPWYLAGYFIGVRPHPCLKQEAAPDDEGKWEIARCWYIRGSGTGTCVVCYRSLLYRCDLAASMLLSQSGLLIGILAGEGERFWYLHLQQCWCLCGTKAVIAALRGPYRCFIAVFVESIVVPYIVLPCLSCGCMPNLQPNCA